MQYVPIIAVYGLNAAGVKGKNNFGNRTALLIKSELIMTVLTYSLKKIAVVPRPDTWANIISFRPHRSGICSGHIYGERVWAQKCMV
ncbi:MAG: hypothetical protein IPJ20_25720 [Flammeovirgaceae bacterium]|nr:hypothetical protein [Flammeovirgaceae bacterium]